MKLKIPMVLFLSSIFMFLSAQENRTFSRTGQDFDSFFERVRAKISYSWQQCREHFQLMFMAAGDKSKHGEQDLKTRVRLKTGELSDEAVRLGRDLQAKTVEFSKDTARKGQTFCREKSDEIADEIESKTKEIQKELRDAAADFQKETGKRVNKAAEEAAETILKK